MNKKQILNTLTYIDGYSKRAYTVKQPGYSKH